MKLLLILALLVAGAQGDCWWTGCQPAEWGGCSQYNMDQTGKELCSDGVKSKYHCCDKGGGGGGDAKSITLDQFNRAAQTKGGSGGQDEYNLFINSFTRAQISEKIEAAKYLAHTVWESMGYTAMREMYCQNPDNLQSCRDAYGTGPGGVIYYGRGPLQLSHDYNYRAASQSIYGNADRLLNDPDLVARDKGVGWDTASYFWSANVHAHSETFGSTLKAINGALECSGGSNQENMWKRCDHYRQILGILGIPLPDRNTDCPC